MVEIYTTMITFFSYLYSIWTHYRFSKTFIMSFRYSFSVNTELMYSTKFSIVLQLAFQISMQWFEVNAGWLKRQILCCLKFPMENIFINTFRISTANKTYSNYWWIILPMFYDSWPRLNVCNGSHHIIW